MSNWVCLWLVLSIACVAWYSSVTIYVAVRGAFDIKSMLRRLAELREETGGG